MNTRLANFVFLAAAGLLILGTAISLLETTHQVPEKISIAFEASVPPPQPAAEPIFPGLAPG